MAHRAIIICDYCGAEEDLASFYSSRHDYAEGRPPPRFVTVDIRAIENSNNCRFIRSAPPAHVAERKGVGQSSTNGTIHLELCEKCVGQKLFDHFEVHDPTGEEGDGDG